MAEPLKKDEALAAAVREAFQRHMENARLAAEALKEKQAASTAQRTSGTPARDPRLAVPKPANEPAPAEEKTVAPAPETKPSSASLDRLVALASPPKEPPRPVEAEHAPVIQATPPVQAQIQPEVAAKVDIADTDSATATQEAEADNGFDFGEALFIEIAPDSDKKAEVEPPKMPRAASLDTPAPARPVPVAEEIFEFRGPPSRERPRMSTASATAEPPQDLDLRSKGWPAPAHTGSTMTQASPAAPVPDLVKDAVPAAPIRKTTRFGVNPAANANEARPSRRLWTKVRIPPALIASLLLAGGIAAVGAYFWANPDKLQSLGALVAPPAATTPETKVAAAPPQAPASQPAPSTTSPAPAATQAPAPAASTRSVSTIAITVDEIDQAVQTARELLASGDVTAAREALESYRGGNDPRALFALAETYDPAIVKDPSLANPTQAKAFYEAAAKAGSQDTAERLARLALVHAN